MPEPIPAVPGRDRLCRVLQLSTSGLRDDLVAETAGMPPDLAGDAVASVIEAELTRPTADGSAIRAAHLASELKLARAIPALVRCVESLVDAHPLRRAAIAALSRLGTAAVTALVAAFEGRGTVEARARIAEALSRASTDDDRVRAALVRMLQDDPLNGARHLVDRGEWRAVPDLVRAVERLARSPVADCAICAGEHLRALAFAIRVLGGALSESQKAMIDEVLDLAQDLWVALDDTAAISPVRRLDRGPRPGRNAPCHCGSGKKYKRCHLEADELAARH